MRAKLPFTLFVSAYFLLTGTAVVSAADEKTPDSGVAGAMSMPPFEVVGHRDPQFVSYGKYFELIERFEKLPDRANLALVLRVVPARAGLDLRNLRVQLVGDDYVRPILVSQGGRLEVPYDEEALRRHAEFVFNVPSGSLTAEINVVIKLDSLEVRYLDLKSYLQRADKAERALMSLVQRMVFPHSDALAVSFGGQSDASVTIHSDSKGPITLRPNPKEVVGIVFDEVLTTENPIVRFSRAPDWVMVTTAPRTAGGGN